MLTLRRSTNNQVLNTESYTYNEASEIISKTENGVTTQYNYDAASQLISEIRPGYSASYTFDGNGNRLTKTVNGATESYTYDDGDKLLTAGTKTYTYDLAGRTIRVVNQGQVTNLTYDAEDRLVSLVGPSGTHTYTYNGLDTRVAKNAGGSVTAYHRDGVGVTAPVIADSSAVYTPGISERRNGTTTFTHSGLKNNSVQTNVAQTVTAARQYDAYGQLVGASGTWAGPFGYGGGFGYQTDETGLQLLGHRYYDSSTGRFLTRDPIKDGRNWYVYCDNNPITRADAEGLSWHDPMVIYVDPGFKGTVIVVGEPGPGKPQGWSIVPAGYHSDPRVDVDYVTVIHPDGTVRFYFPWGLGTPLNPDNSPQFGSVNAKGELSAPGPISDDRWISALDVYWMRQNNEGLNNPLPRGYEAKPGKPSRSPKRAPKRKQSPSKRKLSSPRRVYDK